MLRKECITRRQVPGGKKAGCEELSLTCASSKVEKGRAFSFAPATKVIFISAPRAKTSLHVGARAFLKVGK